MAFSYARRIFQCAQTQPIFTFRALKQFYVHTSSASIVIVIALLVRTVAAQNPVSDLGGWPDGAVTLLGGLYAALHSMSYYNYDVLPPICLAPLWHKIPGLKDLLRGSDRMGSWFNVLVLGCKEKLDVQIREEWDAVIISEPTLDRSPNSTNSTDGFLIFNAKSSGVKAIITVKARDMKVDANDFLKITNILFEGMNDKDASNLLRRWHGMKQFLTSRQSNMIPQESEGDFNEAKEYWLDRMAHLPAPSSSSLSSPPSSQPGPQKALPISQAGLKKFIPIFFPEAPCGPGELSPNAGIDEQSLTVGELAVMLAYNEAVHTKTDGNPIINPLLPCLWLWNNGDLSPTNSMCITFPPTELFLVTDNNGKTCIDVSLDLCPVNGYKEWNVDGFNIYKFGHLPWVLGTLCTCIVSFFVTVASNSTPTLSAAIALYFSIPYSCDNDRRDAGSPPSWNGRCRLRWGDPDPAQGYACGIFSGMFKKRMGKTGTSANRATLVLIVCVVSWIWKTELRTALSFENRGISRWVQLVGAVLESLVGISATFSFPILLSWKLRKHAIICIAGCIFCATNVVLMWLWIYRGVGLLPLRIIGELGAMVLFSVFAASQLVGIGYVNGATTLFVVYAWFHYISISCVLGDSR